MKKFDFKAIIRYFNPYAVDGGAVNPDRDWKAIIISFFLILAAVVAIDGYVLWNSFGVMEEKITMERNQAPAIDKTALKNALKNIQEKEERFRKGVNISEITDPSL